MSTAIQMNHCSRYLCANAQMPTMLSAVVNESVQYSYLFLILGAKVRN